MKAEFAWLVVAMMAEIVFLGVPWVWRVRSTFASVSGAGPACSILSSRSSHFWHLE